MLFGDVWIALSENPLSLLHCPIKFGCHNREGDLQGAVQKLLSSGGIEKVRDMLLPGFTVACS